MQIKLVDLEKQYFRYKTEIDNELGRVISSTHFIQGPQVRSFESELSKFINIPFCISCGNGTDALQIALMACDLQENAEIIIPAFSYVAPLEAAALLKLKPVLIDSDPTSFNIDPLKIPPLITAQTKAVIPVHLFGQACDMESIKKLTEKTGIKIIEDNAQSLGSEHILKQQKVNAGSVGDISTTSFFPSKVLGCFGDGGAIFTSDNTLAQKIKMIANHGQAQKYQHEIVGVNSRLDTIQAAVLSVKLKYLVEDISKRQKVAEFYNEKFAVIEEIVTPVISSGNSHVFHQYTLRIKKKRNDLKKFLEENGIPSMIYYPVPLHLQKAYEYLGYKKGDFPVAELLAEEVLSLPMHPDLNPEELSYIANKLLAFFKA
ncbi:MAG: DegT/DnrJ/EryC1/StrS family aminotransferase [Sporocytophaga sp.]|uniref:DegT/DnrJ/EryC1/StrS family aminotransferase n=1 Tax=Sporocytophaga sp. TaxID=2231183 RepID=UPI001B0DB403|nr:DegT/DnrJ/EryC1/StrS family aminotransferase [Sporocytophaga sp.]MBO9701637.1 DegT/DnrJ/EryC1/StrS family aminotransferase [Sporocytophaga sp.]